MARGGLGRWFKEKWVDVKTGKPCGRKKGEKRKGYPACRPSKRVSKDTPKTTGEMSKKEKQSFAKRKTGPKRTETEVGSPAEDKFLAKHMRTAYKKNPNMTDDQRDRELAIGYKKYENRK
tara:strand:+ start:999 stop:1358 length:360 start_codon:yes stop_codon:yes gene_type:complete